MSQRLVKLANVQIVVTATIPQTQFATYQHFAQMLTNNGAKYLQRPVLQEPNSSAPTLASAMVHAQMPMSVRDILEDIKQEALYISQVFPPAALQNDKEKVRALLEESGEILWGMYGCFAERRWEVTIEQTEIGRAHV